MAVAVLRLEKFLWNFGDLAHSEAIHGPPVCSSIIQWENGEFSSVQGQLGCPFDN